LIFQGAFAPEGVAGGIVGVLITGVQRAAFSNEAGLGSAPSPTPRCRPTVR
jgi:AGCS family alanine or glycine:cation symporter